MIDSPQDSNPIRGLGRTRKAEQKEVQRRDEIIHAVLREVRDEIETVFTMVTSRFEIGRGSTEEVLGMKICIDNLLKNGTTLIARSPVDIDGPAGEREYVLPNIQIGKIGTEQHTADAEDTVVENGKSSQNRLDGYMDGLRYLLVRLLKGIEVREFGKFEVKVVVTDGQDVDELKRTHVTMNECLGSFIPPKASSKGKE